LQHPDGRLEYVDAPLPAPPSAANGRLQGVAASAGRVTGTARVILDPREAARLKAGEILVAPSTNPAWSPLFLQAAGLVTEIGGTLSHGAILAREYGIPAVLNVRQATQRIRSGQTVLVDGYAGTVTLVDEQN
jgi:pyruvate,water dikinase